MDAFATLHAEVMVLIAELERSKQDPKKLRWAHDERERIEWEAWKSFGCPNMLAKDGDEYREWREVGFPMWFTVKSLKTMEPVGEPEHPKDHNSEQDATEGTKTLPEAEESSSGAVVEEASGPSNAITSTPLQEEKGSILGGGPSTEFVFDDTYRKEQKEYMKANGLQGLSASRWA